MRALTVTVILIATIFASVSASRGQSTSSDGESIRKLREEIQKRETAEPPADLIELNRSKLIERRAELRTLLKSEMIKLQKHRTDLGTFITAEETQRINDLLLAYSAEVDRLGTAMQRELAAEKTDSRPPATTTAGDAAVSQQIVSGNGATSVAPAPANPGTAANSIATGTNVNGTALSPGAASNVVVPAVPSTATSPNAAPVVAAAVAGSSDESNETLDCDEIQPSSTGASELDKIICALARDIPERRAFNNLATNRLEMGSANQFSLIKILIAKKLTPSFLVEASEVRLDKQVGSSAGNGISPSLVTRGGVPAILGFAVENGGLTQTTNDTAITFRGNPIGLFNALKNKGFLESAKQDENDPIVRFLKKTSFAFTFNTDRGPDAGVFTGSKQQLSSVAARIEFINNRVPSLYIKDWENFLTTKAQPLVNTFNAASFIDPNGEWIDPAIKSWFEQTQASLAAATDAQVSGVLQAALNKLPIDNLRPETILALENIERAMGVYMSGRDEVVEKINRGTVLTFEYLNKREVTAPDTSNFTLIAEKGTGGGRVDFTFNASLTMFNNLDSLRNFVSANPTLPKPRRLRDFQFAGQIDIPFGNVREFGQFVLFAGGRYERLLENATTDLGQILPNTTGDIGHLQLGLKIPVSKTGFKIPVSITFANRTELIKEKTVKGNFGFSLDLDTLFSKFKPF